VAVTELYGFAEDDLHGAASLVNRELGICLELRDSFYFGGDYYCSPSNLHALRVTIRRNLDSLFDPKKDPPKEKYAEPEFRESALLIEVIDQRAKDKTSPTRFHDMPEIHFLRGEN